MRERLLSGASSLSEITQYLPHFPLASPRCPDLLVRLLAQSSTSFQSWPDLGGGRKEGGRSFIIERHDTLLESTRVHYKVQLTYTETRKNPSNISTPMETKVQLTCLLESFVLRVSAKFRVVCEGLRELFECLACVCFRPLIYISAESKDTRAILGHQ